MAISLGDALGISEVRLPRQSVMALISEPGNCAKMCPLDCLFQTVIGFWEVAPVNHINLRTYRTDHR